jgi:hypothetical protein
LKAALQIQIFKMSTSETPAPEVNVMEKTTPEEADFQFHLIKRPIDTVEQLRDLAKQRDTINAGEATEYTATATTGDTITLPRYAQKGTEKHYLWSRNTFDVAISLNRPESKHFPSPTALRSSVLLASAEFPVLDAPDGLKLEEIEKHKDRWDSLWEQSQHKKNITAFLEKYGADMRRVDKVVGIGLGPPGYCVLLARETGLNDL